MILLGLKFILLVIFNVGFHLVQSFVRLLTEMLGGLNSFAGELCLEKFKLVGPLYKNLL